MGISRTARLRILVMTVTIILAKIINDSIVLLPETLLSEYEQRLMISARGICDNESYRQCYGLTLRKCKTQLGLTARMCLRAVDREHDSFKIAVSDTQYSNEFTECVLAKHYEGNAEAGVEGARCAGNAYSDATSEGR